MSVTVPIRYVRASVALGSRQDWDVAAVLRDAGVSPMLLADTRSRVTAEQAARIAQAIWRHTNDELFGLGAAPVPRGSFRLLAYGLIGAPDGREALTRLSRFVAALPGLPSMAAEIGADTTRLTLDTGFLDDQDGLLVDAILAVCHRFLGWLTASRARLRGVEVPYPRPEDVSVYVDLFGLVPVFGAGHAVLVFDNSVLDCPVMQDEAALEVFLREAPAGLLTRRDHSSSLVDQVRRLLARDSGVELSADQVAARLSMAGPTLRRKLRELGTSFREIREGQLRDVAVQALVHTDVTVAALSTQLGFSETSAFVRAFRRWTGMSPGAYRTAFSDPLTG